MGFPHMRHKRFKCGLCKRKFRKARADQQAMNEYRQNFPEMMDAPISVVCDDCYDLVMAWWITHKPSVSHEPPMRGGKST